jgi:L-alanine-DL-glutamate epimerase-like enolase superfamily enzyme
MKMSLQPLDLPLAHPFTISRGSITQQASLVVRLEHEGVCGLGEVTENSFYGHTIASISQSLQSAAPLLDASQDPAADDWPQRFWAAAKQRLADDPFALSALDMAAHDLSARLRGLPLFQAWGLDWQHVPPSSYTIGIAPLEQMVAKLREAPGWSVYKIKLGTKDDLQIVRQLRQHTDAIFRVDANCGWSRRQTIEYATQLAELGVQFIEQPLPRDAEPADKREVFEQSVLPIIADEDCQQEADVARCADYFHGVNVKLCKCGGLTPALRMLRQARGLGLRTMVGCMIESSVGISAAAHLLPLLDYADLDGAILLRDDPAAGVTILPGSVPCPDRPGSGAQLR